MVKSPFKVSLGISGLEHKNEEALKCRKFNTEMVDFGLLKLNIK
jgi:hypothetical protein